MTTDIVSVYEAKTQLSRLIDQAVAGRPFIITRHGKPVVEVRALAEPNHAVPRIGFLEKEMEGFALPEDFDTMMQDEIVALFEGRE
jgi:antitoxin (DNA-binding transcriptional repressor) of toxin-antitoxin stability system